MEQNSPREPESKDLSALEGQLRDAFGRVAYSHKVHEKDADRYFSRGSLIKVGQIVLSALTTGGIIVSLVTDEIAAGIAGAIASGALLLLSTYSKEVDLGGLAQKHSDTAARLWAVREAYTSVIADLRGRLAGVDELRSRRDKLVEELAAIYANSPRTSPAAYKAAQKALQVQQELTFSDAELDRILPPALRLRPLNIPPPKL